RGPHAAVAAGGPADPDRRGGPGGRGGARAGHGDRGGVAAGPEGAAGGPLPTASGLRSALAGPLSAAALGRQVSAVVADPATGRVLLSQDGTRLLTPASTTKLVTSVAALAALGAN